MDKFHEMFFVNEVFQSIQGEGNFAGVNSLFIRFHFCNLTCTWCDTKFTWLGGYQKEMIKTSDEIKSLISQTSAKHIIFTGGEPALYRLDQLITEGKKYHVETNGTILPVEPINMNFKNTEISRQAMDEDIISKFNWVVSPKLSNSRQSINEPGIRYWSKKEFCVFKFIIRTPEDLNEVDELQNRFSINKEKIYIGLEGQTPESQIRPALVDEIVKRNYHFSPRLHVLLWGNERKK